MRRALRTWWLPALYMGIIFLLSAQSRLPVPRGPWVLSWDKAHHFTAYFFMGLLIFRAAGCSPVWKGMPVLLQTILIGTLYGTLDEFHQFFVPGRDANPFDLIADMTGLMLAAAAAAVFKYLRRDKDDRISKSARESLQCKR
ncbi:MAG: VanZ family protein [Armatimonadota bacterium]